MTSKELREKAKALTDEIDAFAAIPEDQLDADQLNRYAECVEEAKPLAAEIRAAEAEERRQALETIRAHATLPTHVESEDTDKALTRSTTKKRNPYDLSDGALRMSLAQLDPSDPRGQAVAMELRSRAHDAIEQAPDYVPDEAREQVAKLVDRDEDGHIAAHCLRYGSPEYASAFFNYMRTGEHRAALSTTAANGGFLIPFYLDPTIILTNAGSKNPFRQISRIETITTNVWHGVSSAGVTAEWTAEANEFADASPTFAQPTVTPIKADAYIQASFEVTQDSNVAAQIGMLMADAKDRLEAAAFATGTGSTQPEGIVTRLQVTTASRVAANTNAAFGAVDVYNLVNSLPARYQDNCSWVAHWSVYNLVRQFASGAGPSSAFWVDLGPGIPSQLLGRPTYTSSSMASAPLSTATASNDDILVLGDFSQFLIVDRVGMEIVYNPLVLGSNRRPSGEVGWAAFWRVGSDVTNADAFRLLRV